jgi:putative transposase
MARPVYLWRKLNPKKRNELLSWRKKQGYPWHSPPHLAVPKTRYHITAACDEHRSHIGFSEDRIQAFCTVLLETLVSSGASVNAWCVLPNHYHALVTSHTILKALAALGKMHGRFSYEWNKVETTKGRQVWCRAVERYMRSDKHFWATFNYIHHNPVRHGYAAKWQEWPFSSAAGYLEQVGRSAAMETWLKYPVLDYGRGWDDPNL